MLYLASTSPRRQALLKAAGIEFRLHPPGPEPNPGGRPEVQAAESARAKALAAQPPAEGLLLALDTVVAFGDETLGKPADRAEAGAMLRRLAGGEHLVYTAHCLLDLADGTVRERLATSRVRCRTLTSLELETYLDGEDWRDKAGAYGIQADASAFMELIEGDLDTVIGLSVATVRLLLREQQQGGAS